MNPASLRKQLVFFLFVQIAPFIGVVGDLRANSSSGSQDNYQVQSQWWEKWSLEVGVGGVWERNDDYNVVLEDFKFKRPESNELFGTIDLERYLTFLVSVGRRIMPQISVSGVWERLPRNFYTRNMYGIEETWDQEFRWLVNCFGLYIRMDHLISAPMINPYFQAGGGVSLGLTEYKDLGTTTRFKVKETFYQYHLGFLGGILIMPLHNFGFFAQLGYVSAPVIKNLLGDVHQSGGMVFFLGIRLSGKE